MDLLIDGLAFAEGPRWRDGRLYFSDVQADEVLSVDMAGDVQRVAKIDGLPSGLGWLPDGTLLVARGVPSTVLAVAPGTGEVSEYADLTGLASFGLNDMVVSASGFAFVGACDLAGIPTPSPSELICVPPGGSGGGAPFVVDGAMRFPNGPVITPDGRTLIVAETFGQGLVAFDLAEDGTVGPRREWAVVPGSVPDGICLDAEGCVWFADPVAQAAVRVQEGGEVVARVESDRPVYACTLGGPELRTLFLLTGKLQRPEKNVAERPGRIEFVTVDVPGSGSP